VVLFEKSQTVPSALTPIGSDQVFKEHRCFSTAQKKKFIKLFFFLQVTAFPPFFAQLSKDVSLKAEAHYEELQRSCQVLRDNCVARMPNSTVFK
jgi:hypothetical protein